MSHDFNLDGLLNYDDDQAVSPDTIISELGKQLEEATNGFVKGVVREYEGPIESYDQLSAFASIASALGTSVIHKDIQDNLGAIGYQNFKFEFFLTAPKITMCMGLAASMGAFLLAGGAKGKRLALPNSEIMIHQPSGGARGQETEIRIVAENILKTKKVIKVMQELIYATKRFERLDKKELKLVDKSSDENDE